MKLACTLLAAAGALAAVAPAAPVPPGSESGRSKRGGGSRASVVGAAVAEVTRSAAMPGAGFAPQSRVGYTAGDQWEPAIAADDFGNVYVLYPQYGGVPGCSNCADPTMTLQISRDRGATWGAPAPIAAPGGSGQWDAQIAVDPADGRTLYAAWLQDGKSDTVVAKSIDFGNTWSVVVADATNAGTDKPILVARGNDVYVGFNHAQKVWVASSHDGGASFGSVNLNPNGKLGWSLAGGGAIGADGSVYFSWAGYERNGGAKGKVNLFVSKSSDGGATWINRILDVSGAPPDCSAYQCGWAYLGAQVTLAADESGVLYALWNAGTVDKGPERVYFSRSLDAGETWSPKVDVSASPAGVDHAFPAIAARAPGDVRISWMDARNAPLWNTYYRSSTTGGTSWTAETDLSTYVPGFSYVLPAGFGYPFGDYYEIDIDDTGKSHLVWGEGLNYVTPGSIWYTRGN